MQIEIDSDVVMPEAEPRVITRKPRMHNASRIPFALRRCVDAYREAYKVVYGVLPEVTFSGGFIRIKGQNAGVTRVRLKEMTNQLKWRAG